MSHPHTPTDPHTHGQELAAPRARWPSRSAVAEALVRAVAQSASPRRRCIARPLQEMVAHHLRAHSTPAGWLGEDDAWSAAPDASRRWRLPSAVGAALALLTSPAARIRTLLGANCEQPPRS